MCLYFLTSSALLSLRQGTCALGPCTDNGLSLSLRETLLFRLVSEPRLRDEDTGAVGQASGPSQGYPFSPRWVHIACVVTQGSSPDPLRLTWKEVDRQGEKVNPPSPNPAPALCVTFDNMLHCFFHCLHLIGPPSRILIGCGPRDTLRLVRAPVLRSVNPVFYTVFGTRAGDPLPPLRHGFPAARAQVLSSPARVRVDSNATHPPPE